jgi:hypothetical protein
MHHNFMPGDIVTDKDLGVGEVIARGASRGRYWVQVLFANGDRKDFVNKEIKKLKHS